MLSTLSFIFAALSVPAIFFKAAADWDVKKYPSLNRMSNFIIATFAILFFLDGMINGWPVF